MPITIVGPDQELKTNKERSIKKHYPEYKDKYPRGLDLKPGSKLHERIKNIGLRQAHTSRSQISRRYESWDKTGKILTTYVELSEYEKQLKAKDERMPVSITTPYSAAVLETILSYLIAAFFQSPIFEYEGVSPEDTFGTILLEKAIDVHCRRSKLELDLYTLFRDSLAYGIGVGIPGWTVERGYKTIAAVSPMRDFLGRIVGRQPIKTREETIIYEGNDLTVLDPYLILPDPNVPLHKVQDGEFFGWIDLTNIMNLLSTERNDPGMFNVKYLKDWGPVHSSVFSIGSRPSRDYKTGLSSWDRFHTDEQNPADVIYWYQNLIPVEWGLGKEEYPEKWLFGLAADQFVIKAEPLELNHGRYPLVTCCPDMDGHSLAPLSRMETLEGLQNVLDWLFNAHIANVRKTINNTLVVDPYLVNINDVTHPQAYGGGVIRLRRPAWGKGVEGAVHQLGVTDVTRQHIADSMYISEFMDKAAGVGQHAMGVLRKGGPERLTKGEFSGTQQGTFTRLERIARLISVQAMQDLGYFFASHAQQYMSQELWVTTTGRWEETLVKEFGQQNVQKMKIRPEDILIDYDVIVKDGSVPGSNPATVLMQFFEILAKTPELAQKFDLGRIAKKIMRNAGEKNVESLIRVRPDNQVQQQQRAGNMVPFERLAR